MERRDFFGLALGGLLTALVPVVASGTLPKVPVDFRRWHRYDAAQGCWLPIEFESIQTGDQIWIEDSILGNETVLASRGYDPSDGVFCASHRIDPRTNQWVLLNHA